MSVTEPLYSQHSAADLLKNLFATDNDHSRSSDHKVIEAARISGSIRNPLLATPPIAMSEHNQFQPDEPERSVKEPSPRTPGINNEVLRGLSDSDEHDLPQAEAKDISSESNKNVQIDHFFARSEAADEPVHLTRSDLEQFLESFVSALSEDKENSQRDLNEHKNLPSPLNFEPGNQLQVDQLVENKYAEIDELKNMLVEAQNTIITLLTDRVEDKAKIASFEAQMRYLPDFQKTNIASPDASLAQTNKLRTDLELVKEELASIKRNSHTTGLGQDTKQNTKLTGLKNWIVKFIGSTD